MAGKWTREETIIAFALYCKIPFGKIPFDNEIITVDTDYRILVSKQAKEYYTTETFTEFFAKYEGQKITLPARFLPSKEFIEYHNSKLIDF